MTKTDNGGAAFPIRDNWSGPFPYDMVFGCVDGSPEDVAAFKAYYDGMLAMIAARKETE